MLLTIETRKIEPDIAVLEFAGKITMTAERQKMEQAVEDLLRQNQKKIVFDLSGVDYINSTGMGSIVFCFNKVQQAGGGFRVAGLQDRVRKLFKTTRLDTILSFYPSTQAAAESPW